MLRPPLAATCPPVHSRIVHVIRTLSLLVSAVHAGGSSTGSEADALADQATHVKLLTCKAHVAAVVS